MNSLAEQIRRWSGGFDHELRFWDHWLATRGDRWPQDFARRMDPAAPLVPEVAALLPCRSDPARVLDVGAGPATSLGFRCAGREVEVVATDPLAEPYAALCLAAGVAPPIPTRFAVAEALDAFFPPDSFDVVHCRNALDHACDPMRGIARMLAVTRPGGRLLLIHHPDEAEREAYVGLHQWNFAIRDGRFVIWNRAGVIDVSQALASPHRMVVRPGAMVVIEIEKTGPAPPPDHAGALRAWLGAFIEATHAPPPPRG